MELNDEELKQLKELELECLTVLIGLCEQNDLRWCLAEGSLLGAVRHQGIIPWDDDIDVAMPRNDYEILCNLRLPEPYFLQCLRTEPECGILFAKLMNIDTLYVESSRRNLNIHHGVSIDIFPIDYYPDRPLPDLIHWIVHTVMHFRMRSLYADAHEISPLPKKILTELCMFTAKVLMKDARQAVIWYELFVKQTHMSSKVFLSGGAYGRKEIFPISWLGYCQKAQFEGISVNIPRRYDEILRKIYGNYMEYPPEKERTGHHHAVQFRAYLSQNNGK